MLPTCINIIDGGTQKGKYHLRGSVPGSLLKVYFETEQAAIDTLTEMGFEYFQLNDCSWFNGIKPTSQQMTEQRIKIYGHA